MDDAYAVAERRGVVWDCGSRESGGAQYEGEDEHQWDQVWGVKCGDMCEVRVDRCGVLEGLGTYVGSDSRGAADCDDVGGRSNGDTNDACAGQVARMRHRVQTVRNRDSDGASSRHKSPMAPGRVTGVSFRACRAGYGTRGALSQGGSDEVGPGAGRVVELPGAEQLPTMCRCTEKRATRLRHRADGLSMTGEGGGSAGAGIAGAAVRHTVGKCDPSHRRTRVAGEGGDVRGREGWAGSPQGRIHAACVG